MPKEPPFSVDQKSYDLAEHFLDEVPNASHDDYWNLAQAIQQAVEDWFDSRSQIDNVTAMGGR